MLFVLSLLAVNINSKTVLRMEYGELPNAALKMEMFLQTVVQEISDRINIDLANSEHLKTAEVINAWEWVVELITLLVENILQSLGKGCCIINLSQFINFLFTFDSLNRDLIL